MTVLRRLARPMLASAFFIDGLEAVRNPEPQVAEMQRFRPQVRRVTRALGLPDDPKLLVRAGGAVTLLAAYCLATSRTPRLAALTLAVLTAKRSLLRYPVWTADGPEERRELVEGMLRSASLVGGLLIAGADTAGKPSVGWRVRAAREARAAHKGD